MSVVHAGSAGDLRPSRRRPRPRPAPGRPARFSPASGPARPRARRATSAPPSSCSWPRSRERLPAMQEIECRSDGVAPEPGLGLPGPPAARGRGDRRPRRGKPQGLHAHRRGQGRRPGAGATSSGAPWTTSGRCRRGRRRLMEVMRPLGDGVLPAHPLGHRGPAPRGARGAHRDPAKLYRILADEDPARTRRGGHLPHRRRPAPPSSGAAISLRRRHASSSEAGRPLIWMRMATIMTRPADQRRRLGLLVEGEPDHSGRSTTSSSVISATWAAGRRPPSSAAPAPARSAPRRSRPAPGCRCAAPRRSPRRPEDRPG